MPSHPELTLLQRIRFGQLSSAEYQSEDFFKNGHDAARWQNEGRSCYWRLRRSSPGIGFGADAIELGAGQELDGDAYFNAFHAGHWHTLTSVRSLVLRLRLQGAGRVAIFGHAAAGTEDLLLEKDVTAAAAADGDFTLPAEALDGRRLRLSFRLRAGAGGLRLLGGGWLTPDRAPAPVSISVITPSYRRAHFARRTVSSLLADEGVAQVLRRVILVEQSETAELGDLAGERCTWIHQPNYGCAGGCARGLYELTQEAPGERSTHFMLLDDDIMMEVDSVMRVARMAQYATRDVVYGGAMLDLFRPNRLVALAESIERIDLGFHDIVQDYVNADVSRDATLDYVSLARPEGYCAWWFCFAPRKLLDAIGLPWPGFLRWDDINYGLRAAQAGFTSHLAPGVAVWHVPFYSKSAAWTLYFDRYNKLIQNALIGPAEAERCLLTLLRDSVAAIHADNLGVAAASTLAASHYLAGWEHYSQRTFPAALGEMRAFVAKHEKPADRALAKASLIQLLQATTARHGRAQAVHREFAERMPAAYRPESWKGYFATGNLAEPPPLAAPQPQTSNELELAAR